jgi:hypothetical protein
VTSVSAANLDSVTQGWYYDAARTTVWVKFPLASSVATSVLAY